MGVVKVSVGLRSYRFQTLIHAQVEMDFPPLARVTHIREIELVFSPGPLAERIGTQR